ncbi:MAG: hypothetical protein ACTSR8_05550 [Promethearchaeota archaeon]
MPKEKITSNNEFFLKLLQTQNLLPKQQTNLDTIYKRIEDHLKKTITENLQFYLGGSTKRKTALKDCFDLTIVIYTTTTQDRDIQNFNQEIGKALKKKWRGIKPKTIGYEIPYKSNFHINILPGIITNPNNNFAQFYNSATDEILKTSIELQDKFILENDRGNPIRLLKIWKLRREVPINSFFLELMVIKICKGINRDELENQITRVFKYLNENIASANPKDPANEDNVLRRLLTVSDRAKVIEATQQVLEAKTWNKVFKK